MTPTDYDVVLQNEFQDYAKLINERKQTELKLAQKEQFIRATINMLAEDDREAWAFLLDAMSDDDEIGLSDAIRAVLRSSPKKYHTATEVKNALTQRNFDFSRYTSNPLSSVHAALKRLKPEEVETEKIDGVMAWRWAGELPVSNPTTERLLNRFSSAFYGGTETASPENQWQDYTRPAQVAAKLREADKKK